MAHYTRHTQEEVEWGERVCKEHFPKGSIKGSIFRQKKLKEEFTKLFGREIPEGTLISWLWRLNHPDYSKRRERKERTPGATNSKQQKKLFDVLAKSNYIVHVFPEGIFGFENKEEVIAFIEKSKLEGNVMLFKSVPIDVKVKYKVEIGT